MTYDKDRWRDRSIVAQTAAKVTSDIIASFVSAGMSIPDPEAYFEAWQRHIFNCTLNLAGVEEATAASTPHGVDGGSIYAGGSSLPYADEVIKFGKFKGMTIHEIAHATGDDGKPGIGWLKWAAEKLENDYTRSHVKAYLDAR